MAFLVWCLYHKDALCQGGPSRCPEATDVTCNECGHTREPVDQDLCGPCPACGVTDYDRERCEACPLTLFDEAMGSDKGALVYRALDLDWAAQHSMVTLADISVEEFSAIRVIDIEREKAKAEAQRQQ